MNIDLTDQETAALLRELDGIIANDHYFLSPRITILKSVRSKPAHEPLPPPKVYALPQATAVRRRRARIRYPSAKRQKPRWLIRRVGFCLYAFDDSGCRGFIAARPEARPKYLSFSRKRRHQGQHRDCKQYPSQSVTSIPMVLIVSNRRDLSGRPVQSRTDPLRRLVIPDPIHSVDNLDPLRRTPAGYERARDRRVEEKDRQRVIHDASCTRWR